MRFAHRSALMHIFAHDDVADTDRLVAAGALREGSSHVPNERQSVKSMREDEPPSRRSTIDMAVARPSGDLDET